MAPQYYDLGSFPKGEIKRILERLGQRKANSAGNARPGGQ